ncbi:hypothetical protein [Sphingomonas crocodyli]|uniref:Uncharacterized protein n=1 Tax=Sphingomonas crocodyli TaxID=1979270 RepID=A0A437M6Q4_9SPHN|nr:hypothetical protein [Sphingomonas crocodyli]RVT93329.1 hypothetical protein EOD43_05445 [Sphingomonas crocodyli]
MAIRNAYLAPAESPPTEVEVKRALLTFDKIFIADPSDRDFIPPQSFMLAMGMPALFGGKLGGQSARCLGKTQNYDNRFDELLEVLKPARADGLIDVVSTYDLQTEKQFTIGAVLMGDYSLNPEFMLWSYRNVGRDNDVLVAAVSGDKELMSLPDELIQELAAPNGWADNRINDDPQLPDLQGNLEREQLREVLSQIARGRIASTMKAIGYCAAKDLVPVFAGDQPSRIAGSFARRAADVIDIVAEDDPHWLLRNRVLNIAHGEYLNEEVLQKMSIDDVLKLRTSAWGRQAEGRDDLLRSVSDLAKLGGDSEAFDKTVADRINDYRLRSAEVEKQRRGLQFKTNCELVKGTAGTMSSILVPGAAAGFLGHMQSAIGAATLLLAGCMWSVGKIQDRREAREALTNAEEDIGGDICLGLHSFYHQIAHAVKSDVVF